MSLITRCPACGTMFKVVPDQLRISEGWVRCGHCSEVFDATATLQSFAPEELAPVPAVASQSSQAASQVPQPSPAPVVPEATASREVAIEPDAPPETAVVHEPVVDPADPQSEPFLEMAAPAAAESPTADPPPVSAPRDRRPPPAFEDADEDVASQEVSFVQEARRQARWRSTPVRAGLALLALLLGGVLAGQAAYQERDRLAVWQPALRPLLVQGCEWLTCTLGPVRQIEAVAIESSAFQRLRGDAYRLSLSLRNQSDWPLAMPAIELTLTDALDQPVIRRVLTPAELGSAAGVLPPLSEQPASIALAVIPSAGQPRVAGYRILAFYP